MKTRTYLQRAWSISLSVLLLVLVARRLPQILELYQRQGTQAIASAAAFSLAGEAIQIPQNRKMALVFWATWCRPCTVELSRINRMIENKEIAPESVLAISSGEKQDHVQATVSERGYLFPVALDPAGELAAQFKVEATPTIYLLQSDNTIHWVTMGLSPTLEIRLKRFFAP